MAKPRTCVRCGRIRIIKAHEMCDSCSQVVWRQKNPNYKTKHAEDMCRWRKENPQKAQAIEDRRNNTRKRKQWRDEYNQKYYAEHHEELCEYQSRWRRENPKRRDHYKIRRRNKLRGLPDTLTFDEWQVIQERYDHRCAYCQKQGTELVREHKIPANRGGGFTKENIVPSCRSCNCSKKTMGAQEFIESGRAKNPHPVLLTDLQADRDQD